MPTVPLLATTLFWMVTVAGPVLLVPSAIIPVPLLTSWNAGADCRVLEADSSARTVWLKGDSVCKAADHGVLDIQRCAAIEQDSIRAGTCAVNVQPLQVRRLKCLARRRGGAGIAIFTQSEDES
jgi:hypothetical protein